MYLYKKQIEALPTLTYTVDITEFLKNVETCGSKMRQEI